MVDYLIGISKYFRLINLINTRYVVIRLCHLGQQIVERKEVIFRMCVLYFYA
jgi:hypothetical protein